MVSVDDQQEVLRGLINESIIEPLKFLRWRRSAILEIVISPYINERSSDFNEIWYTTADLELSDSHWPNMKMFKIQAGGRPSF